MRITTKRGDGGKTQTCKGKFVPKCDLKIRVCGALDEAISFLGLAKAKTKDTATRKTIDSVQKDLFRIISEIASGGKNAAKSVKPVKSEDVNQLENIGNIMERNARVPFSFVVPGVNEQSAVLHIARTVVRRAECLISELNKKKKINPCILAYLNRLSDLLFIMAVYEEGKPQPLRL
ncbi:MAG: cob(I)yrinic acid a,c-diamide adenosyltransferase [Candidatus Omnitrophota bacterium]|nr:cob(I)yrinic acid a,c-diamide adenosyltransferase [Candidatus Omnitrophota bacterium]